VYGRDNGEEARTMRAVVWHGLGDIRLDEVADPRIEQPTDAVISVTRSAICGTDLHMVRGTMPDMQDGTILGHEAVGIVEQVGDQVRGLSPGDRVVACSTIGCGTCSYCRAGYYAQCDTANPNGPAAGTCFFGGPRSTGPVNGLQAEKARIPYAMTTLVPLPETVSDDQAILLSDVIPTAWFGARLAEVGDGDTVAVLGAGVVGQLTAVAAARQGAGRVMVVDSIPSRLAMARKHNAEPIDFQQEDPVAAIRELTGGIGADRVVDAVGVDAVRPHTGPAAEQADAQDEQFARERTGSSAGAHAHNGQWEPGDAPSQAARWAVQAAAKAGSIGIIGVYPPGFDSFPLGEALNKNLTVKMGNCNHRRYVPELLDLVASGQLDPTGFITERLEVESAIDAYRSFDRREKGWLKTVLAKDGEAYPATETTNATDATD
jgi:threonine dehydrogenase-like Zn-dependent dehydrogenase